MTHTRRQRLWALLVVAVLAVLTAGSLLALRPSTPRDGSAPASEFSAERAIEHLRQFAAEPHPAGSAANAQTIEYLAGALRQLGLSPTVETRTAARSSERRSHVACTVHNVRATLPGRESTGRVLLVSHHDSVPTGPGANDAGVGVASILEIVRALRARPAPRNDVEILFTDCEEAGMVGARGYVDSGALGDPNRVVVLNLEARGASGPTIMFETIGDTAGLMAALRAAGTPATSVSDEVYRMLPNDTDLTVFGEAGTRGMNFAFVDSSHAYHTPQDSLDHVSRSSVQDMGDALLAATRLLADADLHGLDSGSDQTYFSTLGVTVNYPSWLVLPLAVLTVLGFGVLLVYGRRRGLRSRRVGVAAATFALPLVGCLVLGIGLWYGLTAVRPEYLGFTSGDTYRPGYYVAALVCLGTVVLLLWHRWMRRRSTPAEVHAAVLAWFAALALITAIVMPGGSYLFVWPALLGTAALAFAVSRRPSTGTSDSPDVDPSTRDVWWHPFTAAATAIPAVVLLVPIVALLFPTFGISMSAAPLVLFALLIATALVLVEAVITGRPLTVLMLVVALAAPVLIAVGLTVDDYDARHPRPVSLGYAADFDRGDTRWLGAAADPAVNGVLTGEPITLDELYPNLPGGRYLSGPAQTAPSVTAPTAEPLGQTTTADGGREIRLRLRATDANSVGIYADTSALQVIGATVNGADVDGGQNLSPNRGVWRWGMRYAAPPSSGIDMTIRVIGTGPLRLRLISQIAGLPADASPPQLPDSTTWTPYPSVSGQTFAARTFEF